jgi:hypothetical protein
MDVDPSQCLKADPRAAELVGGMGACGYCGTQQASIRDGLAIWL